MTAGYSKTPLWKKLGVRPGDTLLLVEPPRKWRVPDLPDGRHASPPRPARRTAAPRPRSSSPSFSSWPAWGERIPALGQRIFPDGAIWVAWPRRAAGHESDIREDDIRATALPLGLVDVKVAALDEDWSGLRLVGGSRGAKPRAATPG